jgi:hypothetical protein
VPRALTIVLSTVLVAFGVRAYAADLHEVTGFDEYAEQHPETADALSRHPALAEDPDFVRHHPSLADFLGSHSTVKAELEDLDETPETPKTKVDKHRDDDGMLLRHRTSNEHHSFTTKMDADDE